MSAVGRSIAIDLTLAERIQKLPLAVISVRDKHER